MAGRNTRKATRSNRRGMAVIAAIVLVLLILLLVQSQRLIRENRGYEETKAELEQQLKDEEIREGEIEKLEDYVNSDEYIEKIARDKLGLVYEDEIVFRTED